jgi:hypothetical protein
MTRHLRPVALLLAAALACCAAGALGCGSRGSGERELDDAGMRAELAAALAEPETLARMAALVRLLGQLGDENVVGAAAAVDEQLTVIPDADLQLFLHSWAAFDPRAALDHVLDWPLQTKREFGAGQVIYYWAWHQGVVEARLQVDSLTEPSVRKVARGELVKGWARSGDYAGVTEYAARLAHGDLRDRYTAIIVSAIIANDGSDAAMRWADGVPEDANDRFKRTAFRKALRHVSVRDPEKAAAWYERHAEHPYTELGMAVVVPEWVERDPEAAFDWLLSQTPGPERDRAMRSAIRRWLAVDAQTAAAWMRERHGDAELAAAVEPFVLWLAQSDPAEAVRWAEGIPQEVRRARALQIAGTRWRAQDPEAFGNWLAGAELPESTRAALERAPVAGPPRNPPDAAPEESGS